MKIQFADNLRLEVCEVINSMLPTSLETRMAVAFVKYSGLRIIEPALDKCLENGGSVEFIIGLDFRTTDSQSLRAISAKTKQSPLCRLYCYSDPSDNVDTYHPKVYLFDKGHTVKSMVGSSNLTRGGLKDNVEINVILSFDKQDENLETLLDIYARIKYQPTCFVPDSEYIDAYDETIKQAATSTIKIESNKDVRKALEFLRKKEQTLPKPYTAPNTLQGWQKLVYSKLPLTEFNTSFLHQYISEFQRAYPDNQNIEAKIRQVLQQLRDLGLITHVKEGRWIKGQ